MCKNKHKNEWFGLDLYTLSVYTLKIKYKMAYK